MPVPDFAVGEVLTAAAMDSIGLWLVKTQTIGTSQTSIPVTNAFSTTYENYFITVSGGASVAAAAVSLQLGASGTGYYSGQIGTDYTSDTIRYLRDNNSTVWQYAGGAYPDGVALAVTLFRPALASRTGIIIHGRPDYRTNGSALGGNGYHNVATGYTGFTIACSSAITGGTIRVYGYRD